MMDPEMGPPPPEYAAVMQPAPPSAAVHEVHELYYPPPAGPPPDVGAPPPGAPPAAPGFASLAPYVASSLFAASSPASALTGVDAIIDWQPRASIGYPALNVNKDDIGGNFDSLMPTPMHAAAKLSGFGASDHARRHTSMYVQNMRRPSTFNVVTAERARRLGMGDKHGREGGARAGSRGRSQRIGAAVKIETHSIAAVQAATSDADAARLATSEDAADMDIFALATLTEAAKIRATFLMLACQAVLSGLCLVSLWVAFASYREETLVAALHVLEPGLSGITLAFAQISLVGSVLRVLAAHDLAATLYADLSERDSRRMAWAQATSGTMAALSNLVVVVCCLVGTRGLTAVLHGGPQSADGFLAPSVQAAWPAATEHAAWHSKVIGVLFGLRSGFGLFAGLCAFLDAQRLILPQVRSAVFDSAAQREKGAKQLAATPQHLIPQPWMGSGDYVLSPVSPGSITAPSPDQSVLSP
eukprot:TRINITY_DN51845_c0_g1_i1.p1 TRINITY_DN51845_c0_g1~~TRINITY_DN51845_c0_g1_i1.p1  ORF type:complete len:473 (-),score=93.14 TRINITY_DN51845_c0_g1_i1:281-1699(-)